MTPCSLACTTESARLHKLGDDPQYAMVPDDCECERTSKESKCA
ncbi:hypothetical protein Ptr902_00182 [Pyrenophora tritici-repentis]|nr:hypothetical protein Ptr902_00182 [Pyrenophora tritici-repentis]